MLLRPRLYAGVATLALSTACTAVSQPVTTPPLSGTAWVLSTLPGRTLVPDSRATLQFDGERAAGSDGCNRFGQSWKSSAPGALEFTGGKGISTMMACDPALMQQADALRAALAAARSYRVSGVVLVLLDGSGKTVATFAEQSAALIGSTWDATGINNGRQAVVSLAANSRVTLSFGPDGALSGLAGCNNYTARYTLDGKALRITAAAATRRACSDERVMEQEQAFLNALATVATVRFEADRLELRTADGALAVSATRAK